MGNCLKLNSAKSVESSCYDEDEEEETSPTKSKRVLDSESNAGQAGKANRLGNKPARAIPKVEYCDFKAVNASQGSRYNVSGRTSRTDAEVSSNVIEPNEGGRRSRLSDRSTPCQHRMAAYRTHKDDKETASQHNLFVALFDYEARTIHDLPLHKGDLVRVVEQMGTGWCYAELVCKQNGEPIPFDRSRGYLPFNYLAPHGSLECEDWYAGKCRRTDAERKLATAPLGAFLIRESETRPDEYALSVRDASGVKHYRIRRCAMDDQSQSAVAYFVTRRARFATLQQLVVHYEHDADGLSVRLLAPVAWQIPDCTNFAIMGHPDSMTLERHVLALTCVGQVANVYQREAPPIEGLSYDTCDSWEIPKASVELRRKIGAGQFGEVYEALWNGRTPVAVKTLKLPIGGQDADTMKRDFLAEAQILKRLRHPKLIQLYAVCTQDEPFFIVTELMRHGSLLEYLKGDAGQLLTLADMVNVGTQIASGMAYLEARQFVHRDLAARNILVGDRLQVKVADFGLARLVTHDSTTNAENLVYSPKDAKFPIKWTAPEAALCRRFSTKSDVWSFGILLYELVSRGRVPYAGMTNAQVLSEITERGYRMPAPPSCPEKFYTLMLECWHSEPRRRPTFETLQWQLEEYFLDDSLEVAYNDFTV